MPVKGENKGAVTQEISSSPACLCLDDDDTKLTKNRGKISKPLTFFSSLAFRVFTSWTPRQKKKKKNNKPARIDTEDLEKFTEGNETNNIY